MSVEKERDTFHTDDETAIRSQNLLEAFGVPYHWINKPNPERHYQYHTFEDEKINVQRK